MSISTPQRERLYKQGDASIDQLLGTIQFGFFRVNDQMSLAQKEFTPERVAFLCQETEQWIYAATQLCFYTHIANSAKYPPAEIGELSESLDKLESELEHFQQVAFDSRGPRAFCHLTMQWIQTRNLVQNMLDNLED